MSASACFSLWIIATVLAKVVAPPMVFISGEEMTHYAMNVSWFFRRTALSKSCLNQVLAPRVFTFRYRKWIHRFYCCAKPSTGPAKTNAKSVYCSSSQRRHVCNMSNQMSSSCYQSWQSVASEVRNVHAHSCQYRPSSRLYQRTCNVGHYELEYSVQSSPRYALWKQKTDVVIWKIEVPHWKEQGRWKHDDRKKNEEKRAVVAVNPWEVGGAFSRHEQVGVGAAEFLAAGLAAWSFQSLAVHACAFVVFHATKVKFFIFLADSRFRPKVGLNLGPSCCGSCSTSGHCEWTILRYANTGNADPVKLRIIQSLNLILLLAEFAARSYGCCWVWRLSGI